MTLYKLNVQSIGFTAQIHRVWIQYSIRLNFKRGIFYVPRIVVLLKPATVNTFIVFYIFGSIELLSIYLHNLRYFQNVFL